MAYKVLSCAADQLKQTKVRRVVDAEDDYVCHKGISVFVDGPSRMVIEVEMV